MVAIAARADPSTPEGNKESRPKRIKQLSSCRHINACFQREELTTTFGRFMHTKRHQPSTATSNGHGMETQFFFATIHSMRCHMMRNISDNLTNCIHVLIGTKSVLSAAKKRAFSLVHHQNTEERISLCSLSVHVNCIQLPNRQVHLHILHRCDSSAMYTTFCSVLSCSTCFSS